MEIITHARGLLIQFGGLAYLTLGEWMTAFDIVVKILLGVTMIFLGWHQIGILRRRKKYVQHLERVAERAREKCPMAADGKCWMQDEYDKESMRTEKP